MLGRTSPCSTAAAADQNAEPFNAISPSSFVAFRKLAAAMALACEVSGLKKPAPSPRITSTVRPASSTTDAVITVPRALAFARAAFAARSAISRVRSMMCSSEGQVRVLSPAARRASRRGRPSRPPAARPRSSRTPGRGEGAGGHRAARCRPGSSSPGVPGGTGSCRRWP